MTLSQLCQRIGNWRYFPKEKLGENGDHSLLGEIALTNGNWTKDKTPNNVRLLKHQSKSNPVILIFHPLFMLIHSLKLTSDVLTDGQIYEAFVVEISF